MLLTHLTETILGVMTVVSFLVCLLFGDGKLEPTTQLVPEKESIAEEKILISSFKKEGLWFQKIRIVGAEAYSCEGVLFKVEGNKIKASTSKSFLSRKILRVLSSHGLSLTIE